MKLTPPDAPAAPPPRGRRQRTGRAGSAASAWILLCACTVSLLGGCAFPEPWVKPYERERLADPIMKLQRESLAAKHNEHVREVREGSRGGNGVQGGGCGCN
jgi:hypothetical protein